MIDEKTRKQIETYIPSPRDKSLRPGCDYYVNINGRVYLGHLCDTFPADDDSNTYGLANDRGIYFRGLWDFDSFRKGEMYDNKIDCRNRTHDMVDDWERLREIQEKGESDNAES